MLKVILMRHAASQLEQYGKNDRDRTITMEGMHEIDALRPQIQGQFNELSLILCSNVKRTRQTLECIKAFLPGSVQIHYDDSIYQASADILWHKIQTISPVHKNVMIIGHNPSLTTIIQNIEASPSIRVLPTCALAFLETKVNKWHEVSPYNLSVHKIFTPYHS